MKQTPENQESKPQDGGCACGYVRFRVTGAPIEPVGNCHCRACQKASGAAFMTWAIFSMGQVEWIGAEPSWYRSSPIAERGFCPRCGTPLSIHDFKSETYDLPTVLFDDPERFAPEEDIWLNSRRTWVALDENLNHYSGSGPGGDEEA